MTRPQIQNTFKEKVSPSEDLEPHQEKSSEVISMFAGVQHICDEYVLISGISPGLLGCWACML